MPARLRGAGGRWPSRAASRVRGAGEPLLVGAPIALATALLAVITARRVMAQVGYAGPTLDDAYIHFEYARAFAEGHPFRYQAGAAVTSGATSLLWPLVLSPFYLVGLRGASLAWAAWGLAYAAFAGLAWEAFALARPLAGRAAAGVSAALVLVFPAHAWCAVSGMEVLPFAWVIARGVRRASEWTERPDGAATASVLGARRELLVLAWIAPLTRPEGAAITVIIAFALLVHRRSAGAKRWAGVALAGALAQPLFLWLVTGRLASTAAQVKLLSGSPYLTAAAVFRATLANARFLVTSLLDGGPYSSEFVPPGAAPFALLGLLALVYCGVRTWRPYRAAFVTALALLVFAPCAYGTFLVNRLRYLWPFASGWLIGIACAARVLADLAGALHEGWRRLTPLVGGVAVGLLAARLDGALDDAAGSASGIARQQVQLARWAAANLPGDARLGVNDAGALAYFGQHETFDVVGLTSLGEARFWVAGPASRFEHYERLYALAPRSLPTHFVVYPEWFACPTVLGPELEEATVTDTTILGAPTMRAYEADYAALGTGEAPWTTITGGRIVDTLDVADLESEASHGYALDQASEAAEVCELAPGPRGKVADGGRTGITRQAFVAHLQEGLPAQGVVRLRSEEPAEAIELMVFEGGAQVFAATLAPGGWQEISFVLPAERVHSATPLRVEAHGGTLALFHLWFAQRRAEALDGAPALLEPPERAIRAR